jgi:hypothetical protein
VAATVLGELDEREHKPIERKSRDRTRRERKFLAMSVRQVIDSPPALRSITRRSQ